MNTAVGYITRNSILALIFLCFASHQLISNATAGQPESRAHVTQGHNEEVFDIAFSPDSKQIVSSDGQEIILWDITRRHQVMRVEGKLPRFSFDGKYLYVAGVSKDSYITTYRVSDGKMLSKKTIPGSVGIVGLVASKSSSAIYVLSGAAQEVPSYDNKKPWQTFYEVIAFENFNNKEKWRYQIKSGYRTEVISLSSGGDQVLLGTQAMLQQNNRLVVLSAGTGVLIRDVELENVSPYGWSSTLEAGQANDQVILGSGDRVEIRSTVNGAVIRSYVAHWATNETMYANQAVLIPGKKLIVSGGRDRQITVYDLARNKVVARLRGHAHWVRGIAVSPDGRLMASGGKDQKLILWKVKDWSKEVTFGGDIGSVTKLYMSTNENLIIESRYWVPLDAETLGGYYKYSRRMWDVTSGSQRYVSPGGSCNVALGSGLLPECPIKFDKTWPEPIGRWLDARTLRALPPLKVKSNDQISEQLYTSSDAKKAVYFPGRDPYDSDSKGYTMNVDLDSGQVSKLVCKNCPATWSTISSVNVDKGLELWVGYSSSESNPQIRQISVVDKNSKVTSRARSINKLIESTKEWEVNNSYITNSGDIILELYQCCAAGKRLDEKDARTQIAVFDSTLTNRKWGIEGKPGENLVFAGFNEITAVALIIRGDSIVGISNKGGETLWSLQAPYSEDSVVSAVELPNGTLAYGTSNGVVRVLMKSGSELVSIYLLPDGEWLAVTPDGYFNSSSAEAEEMLEIETQGSYFPVANFRDALFRPEKVILALSGTLDVENNQGKITALPPKVTIEGLPSVTSDKVVKIKISLLDQGGGIGEVRIYQNETSIATLTEDKLGNAELLFPIRLISGDNKIRIVASDQKRVLFSIPANENILLKARETEKPSLHAIIVGVNAFKNPGYNLKFAAIDAKAVAELFERVGGGLFASVNVRLLTSPEETTKESILNSFKDLKISNPKDVFLLYVATHGVIDDGKYYLLTSNVGGLSKEGLGQDAIVPEDLKNALMNVPTTKKLVVLDTCSAGALGGVINASLATRGPGEDEAIKLLSRAVGSAVFSASGAREKALEGYKDHGLFTYVLLDGLQGAADIDKDGYINTLELSIYLYKNVREISVRSFNKEQLPINEVSGEAFPILPSTSVPPIKKQLTSR
ncbi:hypothetical protein F6476_22790 [Pseudomonas umsongensis]|uniref:caspase family protein n=1 Tax=Pseudomonas umsongensis TaxID=198618 RepID=UPI0012459CD5|nr:caspase family protein [Pseudomonas umsongensis]QFG31798.1 hypothetical protein F6476_22790 [Pseudomonas umsongensis]